jgi:hypothetical protein
LSAQQFYVLDTNTIIDLHYGKLLQRVFRLPCHFVVTDILREELLNPPFNLLAGMGLLDEPLTPAEVAEISCFVERYPKLSYYDVSVMILARSKNTVLISGDEALRNAAADNGVTCHGTCWLIDYLASEGIISYSKAIAAYEVIRNKPRYPPKEECHALLAGWKQRKKLLE